MRRGNAVGLLLTGRGTFSVTLDFATRLTADRGRQQRARAHGARPQPASAR